MKGMKMETLPTILLVLGVLWLLNDLAVIALNWPWVPILIIIVALGLMLKKMKK